MALPALHEARHDVMVVRSLVPILELAGLGSRTLPLVRGPRGFLDAVRRLRAGRYREGVLLSAAFSAALLFRAGGVRSLRGTATDGRSFLLADAVPRAALGERHRVLQYHCLMRQPTDRDPRPHTVAAPPAETSEWRARLGDAAPRVALFPGSNAPARRWPAERFADLAARLERGGIAVMVLGGPAEVGLTRRVAETAPGAVDLGGRTDLRGLAAVLGLCDALVTNDTGPMHLAGLVGTPTLTLWGSSDPAEVHPLGSLDLRVRARPLPCMPCKKNVCPRSGAGFELAEASIECLRIISVDEVYAGVQRLLARATKGAHDR